MVRELCRSELEDIYEILCLLEPMAAARAASRHTGRASLAPAIELLTAMESETDGARWAGLPSSGGLPGSGTRQEQSQYASAEANNHD